MLLKETSRNEEFVYNQVGGIVREQNYSKLENFLCVVLKVDAYLSTAAC